MGVKRAVLLILYVGGAWFAGFLCGKGNDTSTLAATITALIGTFYVLEEH